MTPSEYPHNASERDAVGIPNGLNERIYVAWRGALREMCNSPTQPVGEQRYQFCCGYLQALEESQCVGEHVCRFLNGELQTYWVETLTALRNRGR